MRDRLRKLLQQGVISQDHIRVAAIYERLRYSGYKARQLDPTLAAIKSTKPRQPDLSGLQLAQLDDWTSDVLNALIIEERSIIAIGYGQGATSRTAAYRQGLRVVARALNNALQVLG